jgi:hypothetical protein
MIIVKTHIEEEAIRNRDKGKYDKLVVNLKIIIY